ncbi:hypothetical protein I3843_10G154000 [Carya illinoinensis]|nr:hypothetical protein I3843_10G154000 [Carya illinoinensis]
MPDNKFQLILTRGPIDYGRSAARKEDTSDIIKATVSQNTA